MISFTPFPELNTAHFLLRRASIKDADEIFTLRSSEEVNRYIDRPRAATVSDAENFIRSITERINRDESIWWAVSAHGNEKMIGSACLFNFSSENGSAEIGYELLPAWHRKGVMKEVIPAVIDYAFAVLQLKKLEAIVWDENLRSIQLLLQNNFRKERDVENDGEGTQKMTAYLLQNPFYEA